MAKFLLAPIQKSAILSHMAKHDTSLTPVFAALADPTRRDILTRLADGPQTVTDLAAPYGMALPTVLAHIGKLEDGGLVRSEKRGRTRLCFANAEPMAEAADWLTRHKTRWEARLDRLEAYLDKKDKKT